MTLDMSARPLDCDLVFEFFWRFAAFECALKREGFLRSGRKGAAEPDWDRFGCELKGSFAMVSTLGFGEAVKALHRLAPRRQTVREGRLHWEPVARQGGDSDEMFIMRLLKTVRNNLFHGGKYPDGQIDEIARNREILRAARTILEGCYEIHSGVRQRINEAAPLRGLPEESW